MKIVLFVNLSEYGFSSCIGQHNSNNVYNYFDHVPSAFWSLPLSKSFPKKEYLTCDMTSKPLQGCWACRFSKGKSIISLGFSVSMLSLLTLILNTSVCCGFVMRSLKQNLFVLDYKQHLFLKHQNQDDIETRIER